MRVRDFLKKEGTPKVGDYFWNESYHIAFGRGAFKILRVKKGVAYIEPMPQDPKDLDDAGPFSLTQKGGGMPLAYMKIKGKHKGKTLWMEN